MSVCLCEGLCLGVLALMGVRGYGYEVHFHRSHLLL